MRGKRSQVALSRRLGYRGNVVAKWEGGSRSPTFGEMLRACARIGIDVPGALRRRPLYDELEARRAILLAGGTPRGTWFGAQPVVQVSQQIVAGDQPVRDEMDHVTLALQLADGDHQPRAHDDGAEAFEHGRPDH